MMKRNKNRGTDLMKQTASKANQEVKQVRTEGKPTTGKNEEREIGKTRRSQ